jgi:PAS domain S-box-containing protein
MSDAMLPDPLTAALPGEVVNALIRMQWESPFPALLQDASFRIVDLNPAAEAFIGCPRDKLVGIDPIELQPREDHADVLRGRQMLRAGASAAQAVPPLQDRRFFDAQGRLRWARVAGRVLRDEAGRLFLLSQLQDTTAEHAARDLADNSARELDDWFVLSPVGMLLYDEAGMLVRSNPACDALVGPLPATLDEAPASLQNLLAWDERTRVGTRRGAPALQPGGAPLVTQGWIALADGSQRHLRATVRCYLTPDGHRRFMAVVEDRSAEEERDLAQMQIGALMDTAGVGLATFQESSGWVRQRARPPGESGPPPGSGGPGGTPPVSAALQSISRDIVLPESLPEYERLQQALRHAQRAEVRYAIRHPELGRRWLLTRVEPATLASGKRTTSVVTLDVTEQHLNEQRSEQLLHEVSTILENSTAGIAYVRGGQLVRCNRRFEAMVGLRGVGVVGASIHELFGRLPQARRVIGDAAQTLTAGRRFETEIEVVPGADRPGRPHKWFALSVRRTGVRGEQIEAIAELSDITRLKTQQTELENLARDRELMFSLSEVGIAFVRQGRIEQGNTALAQLLGRPVEELLGSPLELLFRDAETYRRQWEQEEASLRQYGRWVGERQLRRRDGRLLWVQASLRLVREDDPASGMIAAYVNVDDRHRAEQVVALQAERTRAILDSVLVGIVTVGPRGIEWMNRSARRMFGGDLVDFLNQSIGTVATPEPDHPFRQTHYLDDLVEGEAETFECQVKARDGREFWVVGNVVATGREATGRQLTYALLDIERRRLAEARMSQAQASLQRVIEAAPLAITLRDARTLQVLQINHVAARSVGRSPAELVGSTPEQIFPPAVAQQRRADMVEALRSRDVTQREYRNERPGEPQVWDARYLPLATAPGHAPDQLLLVATDVTEQRAAQQAKFDAAITQREMLVKEVHHRIKNNLQGVAGLLQQIAQRKPEVAPAIAEVVGQVQAIAQVYGLQVGATGPLRVKALVESITASVQRTFGCQMHLEVRGSLPEVWALPEAESIPVALSINELLTNAVKHSAGLARVDCLLETGDQDVKVTIANLGRLPDGFSLSRYRGGVSGLGLVRALLPRRSAIFSLEQSHDEVVAVIHLVPPSVMRVAPA